MSRDEHQRNFDCLTEELHALNQRVLDVQYERDKEGMWLAGWDARDVCATELPPLDAGWALPAPSETEAAE